MNSGPTDHREPGEGASGGDRPASARNDGQTRYVYLPLSAAHVEDEVNILDYWRAITRRKWIVAVIVILLTGAVSAYAYLKEPVFVAEVVMTSAQGGEVSSDVPPSTDSERAPGRSGSISVTARSVSEDEAIAILTSRIFTEAFIRDRNLIPILLPEEPEWMTKLREYLRRPRLSSMWAAYQRFDRNVRFVVRDNNTGLTTLSIRWSDPEVATEWANDLVARLNRSVKKRDIELAQKSLDYLNAELARTSILELQQALYGLIEQNITVMAIANVRDEYAFEIIDPAAPPQNQEFTIFKRAAAVIASFFVSLFVGALFAIFLGYLERQKQSSRQRESTLAR